jgi:hypothetical protein
MGTTTFTGPIQAGTIIGTSGNIPGNNVDNVGRVVMGQSYVVVEAATIVTDISIPAASTILSIKFVSTVAFTNNPSIGSAANPATGAAANTTYFTNTAPVGVGVTELVPSTLTQSGNWVNVGYSAGPPVASVDIQVVINGGAVAGAGRGVLVVEYLQGYNQVYPY